MKGKPKTALKYLKKLVPSAERICEEAVLLRMMNKFKSAEEKARKALKIFKSENDQEGICYCLWLLGGIGRYGGNPKKGFENFGKAYALSKDKISRAYILCGLGGTARLLGKFEESFNFYRKAMKIFLKTSDAEGLAYSFCGLGSAYRMKGNFKKSYEFYRKAVSVYKKTKDYWNMAYSEWGLSQTLWFLKRKRTAVSLNKKIREVFRKYEDERGVMYADIEMANFLRMEREFKKAQKVLRTAEKIAKKLNLKFENKLIKKLRNMISKENFSPYIVP